MPLMITNTSAKVIGIGETTVLPGETKEVPPAYAGSPILEVYRSMGFATLSGEAAPQPDGGGGEKTAPAKDAPDNKEKLASLKGASDEEVAAMAKELGINPAECKDLADVRKKVKAALSK